MAGLVTKSSRPAFLRTAGTASRSPRTAAANDTTTGAEAIPGKHPKPSYVLLVVMCVVFMPLVLGDTIRRFWPVYKAIRWVKRNLPGYGMMVASSRRITPVPVTSVISHQ